MCVFLFLHQSRVKRRPALIAFTAMLLLWIMPQLSKWMMNQQACVSIIETFQHHHSHQLATNPSKQPQHQLFHHARMNSITHDALCGYCQLLVHLPVILWNFLPLLFYFSAIIRKALPSRFISYHSILFAGLLQARAPPVVILSKQ